MVYLQYKREALTTVNAISTLSKIKLSKKKKNINNM